MKKSWTSTLQLSWSTWQCHIWHSPSTCTGAIRSPSYSYQVISTDSNKTLLFTIGSFGFIPNSPECKLIAIILDIARFNLYKPVQTGSWEEITKQNFLKLEFRNKGLSAVNISDILNHKKIKSAVSPYFKSQSPPVVSYSYSTHIAPEIFNFNPCHAEPGYVLPLQTV